MQRTPLLLIARSNSRPQLPYLSQPHRLPASAQRFLARLLTTENRRYVTHQTWLAIKWSAVGWTMLGLLGMAYFGWQSEMVEREHPSPPDWRFKTRTLFRMAHMGIHPDAVTDWASVASSFRGVLHFLEDPARDGQDVSSIAPTSTAPVPVAYDISRKSHPWRTGYFEVVMACARAAEMLHDTVVDKTQNIVFPKDVVIGPSNSNPRPLPAGGVSPPLEENCSASFEPPEVFYNRILQGQGFTQSQRIDAALAWANWAENQGDVSHADELYGVARRESTVSAVPAPSSPSPSRSSSAAPPWTANKLRAHVAQATFCARTGRKDTALTILIPALQALRSAPAASLPPVKTSGPAPASWFAFSTYPAPGPSGDEPLSRAVAGAECLEAEIMLYIGEILFASSKADRAEGLAWTRDAVGKARSVLDAGSERSPAAAGPAAAVGAKSGDGKTTAALEKCAQCLALGAQNWAAMLDVLAASSGGDSSRGGWNPFSSLWKATAGATELDIEHERSRVEELRAAVVRRGAGAAMGASAAKALGQSWLVG